MRHGSNTKLGSMPQPYLTPLLDAVGQPHTGVPGFSLLSDLPPILFLEKEKAWVLTRHHDVKTLLEDERFKTLPEHRHIKKAPKNVKELLERKSAQDNNQRMNDPACVESFLEKTRLSAETAAQQKLQNMAAHKRLDSVFQYAYGVSNRAIAELFHIPDKHLSIFIKFARAYIDIKTQADSLSDDEIFHIHENLAIGAELIKAHTHSDTQRIFPDENNADTILEVLCSMLIGGLDLAIQMIAGGIQICFRHQSETTKIIEDNLWSLAPAEIYRYFSPVNTINPKIAAKTCSLNEHHFEKGSKIYPFIAAANRDATVFKNPERFEITRDNRNVIFYDHDNNPIGRLFAFMVTEVALRHHLERK